MRVLYLALLLTLSIAEQLKDNKMLFIHLLCVMGSARGCLNTCLYYSSTIKCKRCFTGGEPDLPTSDVNVQEPDVRRQVISRPQDPPSCVQTLT